LKGIYGFENTFPNPKGVNRKKKTFSDYKIQNVTKKKAMEVQEETS